jgi:hypothetical protein
LIYHEGRAYRVIKAKLPPEVRDGDGENLATKDIYICPNCGASHEGEVERCHGCNSHMAGEVPIKRTLRIDNVEAAPLERITANDEERVRQGFDIQTVFAWPRKDGKPLVTNAEFKCADQSILTLQYANSAEISRLNKGLKRRRDRTVFGFLIDPRSGYWAKSENTESDTELPPDVVRPVRIVPIVRDHKNALLLRFSKPEDYEQDTMTTVQHALIRGIELIYQLEEGEILGEPLPDRDNRRAILAYEATEGGAGVLTQLIHDPTAIQNVAKKALDLMHFTNIEAAVSAGDGSLLVEKEGEACVRGCYRCLLSYFNQPDQELIDRRKTAVKQLLVDLARGQTELQVREAPSESSSPWIKLFEEAELPQTDTVPVKFADVEAEFAWREHLVAATTNSISDSVRAEAASKGWEVISLHGVREGALPDQLISLLKG